MLTKGTAVRLAGLAKVECNGREGVVIGSVRTGVDGIRRVPLDLGDSGKLAVPVHGLLLSKGGGSGEEAVATPC